MYANLKMAIIYICLKLVRKDNNKIPISFNLGHFPQLYNPQLSDLNRTLFYIFSLQTQTFQYCLRNHLLTIFCPSIK